MLPQRSRGTVLVKSWDSKELKIPGCVSTADSDKHTAEVAPVRFLTCFQRCRKTHWVLDDLAGHLFSNTKADDSWPSCPRGGGHSPP